MSFEIAEARSSDFEVIYPLLQIFDESDAAREKWKQIFVNHWDVPEDYHGYILKYEDRVVGYIGLIFSHRTINNGSHKFCNLTSWIVEEEFRGVQALRLLRSVLNLKGYTFTIFSATDNAREIYQKMGFQFLDTHFLIVLPFLSVKTLFTQYSVHWKPDQIRPYLNENETRLLDDHLPFDCLHLLVRKGSSHCYLVLAKTKRMDIPFAVTHYIGNPDIFLPCINRIALTICLHTHTFGLIVDKRFLRRRPVRLAVTRALKVGKMFISDTLAPRDMDALYSEVILLNL